MDVPACGKRSGYKAEKFQVYVVWYGMVWYGMVLIGRPEGKRRRQRNR